MAMNLKDEILGGESPVLEFKRDIPDQALKYLKTVSAFANCSGGKIVFGVDSDMSICGMDEPFAARDKIADAIANGIEPTVVPDISFQTVNGKTLIVVEIAQGPRCPYWVKSLGKESGSFIRYDATTRAADADVLRELTYDGSENGFDMAQCRLLELTPRKVSQLCKRMKAKAVSFCETPAQRRAVRPVTEDKLEEWGILTRRGGKLVAANAFALLSGDKALNTVVKCGIFRGTEHRKLLDSREFGGPIQDQIDAVHEWLLSKINMAAVIKGVYRHDVYEFPEGALRELITNAVMHRNYAVYGSDIQVALYDDRLEIISPGGLPRGMTVQRMLSGCSRCRNKAIAEAFAYMHVAEKWGLGIPNAMHEFVEHGLSAPEYTDWGNAVKVTVRRLPKEPNDTVNDTVDVSLNNLSEGQSHQTSSNNETSQPSNVSLNVPLKSRNVSLHDAIVALVRDNPGINRKNLAFHLKVTVKTIDRLLPSLANVERRGSKKTGGYYCK